MIFSQKIRCYNHSACVIFYALSLPVISSIQSTSRSSERRRCRATMASKPQTGRANTAKSRSRARSGAKAPANKVKPAMRISEEFVYALADVYSESALDKIRNSLHLLENAPLMGTTVVRSSLARRYGGTMRAAQTAMEMARAKGVRCGIFRPVTIWPFPERELTVWPRRAVSTM